MTEPDTFCSTCECTICADAYGCEPEGCNFSDAPTDCVTCVCSANLECVDYSDCETFGCSFTDAPDECVSCECSDAFQVAPVITYSDD